MASDTGKLTVLKIKAAKAGKHFDGGGLFLQVIESGLYWRMKCRHVNKEKLMALGVYPERGVAPSLDYDDDQLKFLSAVIRVDRHSSRSAHMRSSPSQANRIVS